MTFELPASTPAGFDSVDALWIWSNYWHRYLALRNGPGRGLAFRRVMMLSFASNPKNEPDRRCRDGECPRECSAHVPEQPFLYRQCFRLRCAEAEFFGGGLFGEFNEFDVVFFQYF